MKETNDIKKKENNLDQNLNLESIREKNKKEFLSIVKNLKFDKIDINSNSVNKIENNFTNKFENTINTNVKGSMNLYKTKGNSGLNKSTDMNFMKNGSNNNENMQTDNSIKSNKKLPKQINNNLTYNKSNESLGISKFNSNIKNVKSLNTNKSVDISINKNEFFNDSSNNYNNNYINTDTSYNNKSVDSSYNKSFFNYSLNRLNKNLLYKLRKKNDLLKQSISSINSEFKNELKNEKISANNTNSSIFDISYKSNISQTHYSKAKLKLQNNQINSILKLKDEETSMVNSQNLNFLKNARKTVKFNQINKLETISDDDFSKRNKESNIESNDYKDDNDDQNVYLNNNKFHLKNNNENKNFSNNEKTIINKIENDFDYDEDSKNENGKIKKQSNISIIDKNLKNRIKLSQLNTNLKRKSTKLSILNKKTLSNMSVKTENKHFCPFCDHCNNIEDKYMDSYVNSVRKAKGVINRSFAAILRKEIISKNFKFDSFLDFNMRINEDNFSSFKNHNNEINNGKININNSSSKVDLNEDYKRLLDKDIESLINMFPQENNTGLVDKIVSRFLNALIDDKINYDVVLNKECKELLESRLISKGLFFSYKNFMAKKDVNSNNKNHKYYSKSSNLKICKNEISFHINRNCISITTLNENSSFEDQNDKIEDIKMNNEVEINKNRNSISNYDKENSDESITTKSNKSNKSKRSKKSKKSIRSIKKQRKSDIIKSNIMKASDFFKNNESLLKNIESKFDSIKTVTKFQFNDNNTKFKNEDIQNTISNNKQSNKLLSTTNIRNELNDIEKEKLIKDVYIDSEIDEYLEPYSRKNIKLILAHKYVKQAILKESDEAEMARKDIKLIFLLNILIEILSEISFKNKERAILIYKCFKYYFINNSEKYATIFSKLNEKIYFYKDLCKLIVQQKHKHIEKIEVIAEIIATTKLSSENLNNHKKLIKDLLHINNEKREELYLKNSEIEILKKELNFFVYDFEKIKLNTYIRDQLKEIHQNELSKIKKNIDNELSHIQVNIDRSLLINADIYLFLSGHRKYFYDQKQYYLIELDKYKTKIIDYTKDKNFLKDEIDLLKKENEILSDKLKESLRQYKQLVYYQKESIGVQTDIDNSKIGIMEHHHNSFVQKRKEILKISVLSKHIDEVLFSKNKILQTNLDRRSHMNSILNMISEIYECKLIDDIDTDLQRKIRYNLDDFVLFLYKKTYKNKSQVDENINKLLYGVYELYKYDIRIYYFARFCGLLEYRLDNYDHNSSELDNELSKDLEILSFLKNSKISSLMSGVSNNQTFRREILDVYLKIISSFTLPLYQMIQIDIDFYMVEFEYCIKNLKLFDYLNYYDISDFNDIVYTKIDELEILNYPFKNNKTLIHIRNEISNSSGLKESGLLKLLFSNIKIFDSFGVEISDFDYNSYLTLFESFIIFNCVTKFSLPNDISSFTWEVFISNLLAANLDLNLTIELIISILLRRFKNDTFNYSKNNNKKYNQDNNIEKQNLKSILSVENLYHFTSKQKKFKINLSFFVYTVISFIERKISSHAKKLDLLFDKYDSNNMGFIKFTKMEEAICYLINTAVEKENNKLEKINWKISNFVTSKFGQKCNDFVLKNEFISYLLDNNDLKRYLDYL